MKDLRTYVTKANLYKGGAASVATAGTLAVLAGGSASAMSYTPGYGQSSYSSNSNSSYMNNYHRHHNHHHNHNHRHNYYPHRYW